MHNTNDIVRLLQQKFDSNSVIMNAVVQMLKEIKVDMKQYTYHMRMDCVDVSEFFPLSDATDLARFMDRSHKEWDLRRKGFYHLLYTTVTNKKRRFPGALLHAIFTREYIANHKWPNAG